MKSKIFAVIFFLVGCCLSINAQKTVYLECDGKFFPVVEGVPVYSVWALKSPITFPKDTVIPEGSIVWGACQPEMIDDALPELRERYYILYTSPNNTKDKQIRITSGNFTYEEIEIMDETGLKKNVEIELFRPNIVRLLTREFISGRYLCRVKKNGVEISNFPFSVIRKD